MCLKSVASRALLLWKINKKVDSTAYFSENTYLFCCCTICDSPLRVLQILDYFQLHSLCTKQTICSPAASLHLLLWETSSGHSRNMKPQKTSYKEIKGLWFNVNTIQYNRLWVWDTIKPVSGTRPGKLVVTTSLWDVFMQLPHLAIVSYRV